VPMMLQPVWPAYNFRNLYRRKESKLDQLYNTDKSGSNWQDLPTRALAFEREREVCSWAYVIQRMPYVHVLWKRIR
jgi:hypothetical protein